MAVDLDPMDLCIHSPASPGDRMHCGKLDLAGTRDGEKEQRNRDAEGGMQRVDGKEKEKEKEKSRVEREIAFLDEEWQWARVELIRTGPFVRTHCPPARAFTFGLCLVMLSHPICIELFVPPIIEDQHACLACRSVNKGCQ